MIGPGIARISPERIDQALATLQVDVIADVVCPWCYLGKKQLDDALAAVGGPRVVNWHPFQLNPDMPGEGMSVEAYLASKIGDAGRVLAALDRLVDVGREAGIDFRFDRIRRVPNTLNAHRLMNLAAEQGVDTSLLIESLLHAFFSEGLDLTDTEVLVGLGQGAGLARHDVVAALEDDRTRAIVLAREAQLRQNGVVGAPDFLINRRLFVAGAQRTETLVTIFDRAMFGADSDLSLSPTVH